MQYINTSHKFRNVSGIDNSEYTATAYERKTILEKYSQLIAEGCSQATALKVLELTRATYYRWKRAYDTEGLFGLEDGDRRPNTVRKPTWSEVTEKRVCKLRRTYKFFGKYKIAVMYKRSFGKSLSVSTIGRILTSLTLKGRIKPVAFYSGDRNPKARTFKNHAQRIPKGIVAKKAGDLVQLDHTTVYLPGATIKHFKVVCPITKISVERAYKQATSGNAADFLSVMKEKLPFRIRSIQVDGGSEFMKEFDAACEKNEIPLYVLPPRSPELNGCVERGNKTVKNEFYSQYNGPITLDGINKGLSKFFVFYNEIRPHQALQYLTPWEYYTQVISEAH